MYTLMYAMVDSAQDVYHNVNQVYMAGLMTAPMVVIELSLMAGMYQNKRLNVVCPVLWQLAEKAGVSVRDPDRALWRYSKTHQP